MEPLGPLLCEHMSRVVADGSMPAGFNYCSFAHAILRFFATCGADIIDVPLIQPADPFLDIAGEGLRGRIFLTGSDAGETLCLRHEFRLPTCLDYIKTRVSAPRRRAYLGEIFRQCKKTNSEFLAGLEDLGNTDIAATDARLIADAYALLEQLLPGQELAVTIGDQTIFEAVLAGLGLPPIWERRLVRVFGMPDQLNLVLADFAKSMPKKEFGDSLTPFVVCSHLKGLTAHIAAAMELVGISPAVGRTPEEIARRHIEKAELARVTLPQATFDALKTFLLIRVPFERAPSELADFAKEKGLMLGAALDCFAARAEAIANHCLPSHMIYDAGYGRPLDCYTGLAFQISVPEIDQPLLDGGRYDQLLALLGAPRPVRGVGFSVWLDRIQSLGQSIA